MASPEEFKKKNQPLFDKLMEEGKQLAAQFVAQGFDYWETAGLWDVQNSPHWNTFINSTYYSVYNQLLMPMSVSGVTKPGEAFKSFCTAFIDEFYNPALLADIINDTVKRAGGSRNLLPFDYVEATIPTAKISAKKDEVKNYRNKSLPAEEKNLSKEQKLKKNKPAQKAEQVKLVQEATDKIDAKLRQEKEAKDQEEKLIKDQDSKQHELAQKAEQDKLAQEAADKIDAKLRQEKEAKDQEKKLLKEQDSKQHELAQKAEQDKLAQEAADKVEQEKAKAALKEKEAEETATSTGTEALVIGNVNTSSKVELKDTKKIPEPRNSNEKSDSKLEAQIHSNEATKPKISKIPKTKPLEDDLKKQLVVKLEEFWKLRTVQKQKEWFSFFRRSWFDTHKPSSLEEVIYNAKGGNEPAYSGKRTFELLKQMDILDNDKKFNKEFIRQFPNFEEQYNHFVATQENVTHKPGK